MGKGERKYLMWLLRFRVLNAPKSAERKNQAQSTVKRENAVTV